MIVAASATDGIFIEHAQAGHGLARVKNACLRALDSIDKSASHGGNAAQALQDIQDHAFTGKQNARVVPDHGNRLAFVQPYAVKNFAMTGDFRVTDGLLVQPLVNFQNAGNGAHARQNAVLLGENGGCSALLRVNAGTRSRVTGGFIFQQPVFQNVADSTAVPIHTVSCLTLELNPTGPARSESFR